MRKRDENSRLYRDKIALKRLSHEIPGSISTIFLDLIVGFLAKLSQMKRGSTVFSYRGFFVFSFSSIFLVACSPTVPPVIPSPRITLEKSTVLDNEAAANAAIDILFVIDDSGSMSSHQNNLMRNIDLFVSQFWNRQDIDYQIGVLTTTMNPNDRGTVNCCGELVNLGGYRFVRRDTPNGQDVLRRNLIVGSNGSWKEMSFSPVIEALSPAKLATTNAGFYREDAFLAIIFITDAEDQSEGVKPQDLYDFLYKLKNGRADRFTAFGVIVPSLDPYNCPRDDGSVRPTRIEQFLDLVKLNTVSKNVYNLCDPHFADNLITIGDILRDYIGSTIALPKLPVVSSIQVTYGSQVIPPHPLQGWSYDPKRNAIVLGSQIQWSDQPSGTRVKVTFDVARLPEEQVIKPRPRR